MKTSSILSLTSVLAALTSTSNAALIGHWTFDEGSGTTAADSSGNGFTATTTGATTWIPGVSGNAANNPKFTIAAVASSLLALADGTSAFTISLWANTTTSDDFAILAGFEGTGGSGDRYGIKTSSGNLQISPGGVVADANLPTTSAGEWIHIVAVNDPGAGNSKIYVNGAQSGPDGSVLSLSSSVSEWTMGTYWNSNAYDYTGALDDVQVYDEALSPGDVAFLFGNPGTVIGGEAGPIALGPPLANTVTNDGATVECRLLNEDANDVTLVWAKSDEGETDLSSWTNADGGGSYSFGGASQDDLLSHSIPGLDGDTIYFFRFFATSDAGSDWSEASSFATGLGESPAPGDLTATPQDTPVGIRVDLSWTDSYNNETGFVIQRSTDAAFGGATDEFTVGANETSFSDSSIVPNTTYFYRIAALGVSGRGPFSSNFEITTGDGPELGLVAHWKFDEGSGFVAADSSGSGLTATQAGTEGSWVTGKCDGAYEFGGGDSHFELSDSASLQLTGALTVAAWVKPTGESCFGVIAGIDQTGGSSNDMYTLKTNDADGLRWDLIAAADAGSNVSLDSPSTLGAYSNQGADWVHVVGVLEPGVAASLYVNGDLVAKDTTDVPVAIQSTSTAFQIGHNASNSGGFPLNAAVDDIQIYNLAASADDVAFLYNNPCGVLGEATSIQLTIAPNAETPGSFDFSWSSNTGRVYDLVSSTDLSEPVQDWAVWDGLTGIPATSPQNTLTGVTTGGAPKRFFAVIEK